MKKETILRKLVMAVPAFTFVVGLLVGSFLLASKSPAQVVEVDRVGKDTCGELTEWEILTMAIAKTESEFDPLARGKSNDLGVIQATPIWVKEVNKIIGDEKFLHTDALEPGKAMEMFNIYQEYYNPEKSISKAINVHNPKGDAIGYSVKVRKNMESVKQYERIRAIVHGK